MAVPFPDYGPAWNWARDSMMPAGLWPAGDEDALGQLSVAWRALQEGMDGLAASGGEAIGRVLGAYSGETGGAIAARWQMLSGSRTGLAGYANLAGRAAEATEQAATAVLDTKVRMHDQLTASIEQLFVLAVLQGLADPDSIATAPGAKGILVAGANALANLKAELTATMGSQQVAPPADPLDPWEPREQLGDVGGPIGELAGATAEGAVESGDTGVPDWQQMLSTLEGFALDALSTRPEKFTKLAGKWGGPILGGFFSGVLEYQNSSDRSGVERWTRSVVRGVAVAGGSWAGGAAAGALAIESGPGAAVAAMAGGYAGGAVANAKVDRWFREYDEIVGAYQDGGLGSASAAGIGALAGNAFDLQFPSADRTILERLNPIPSVDAPSLPPTIGERIGDRVTDWFNRTLDH